MPWLLFEQGVSCNGTVVHLGCSHLLSSHMVCLVFPEQMCHRLGLHSQTDPTTCCLAVWLSGFVAVLHVLLLSAGLAVAVRLCDCVAV
jgi:nitrate reductase gamma subunit